MYNNKAIEKLIEELVDEGDCPGDYELGEYCQGCSMDKCIDCWKQALQQEPDE